MTNFERIKEMSVEEMADALMCPAEFDNRYLRVVDESDIDNLVEEMVGESNV